MSMKFSTKKDSCPNCNCSGSYIHQSDVNGKKVKNKSFCWECQEFVKLVAPGTGKVFRKYLKGGVQDGSQAKRD